jgi:putative addiction module killer protein
MIRIKNYKTLNGISPFKEWLTSLKDQKAKVFIARRVRRLTLGNLGEYKRIQKNLYELKLDYAGGYRVYFVCLEAIRNPKCIILLCGGTKRSQKRNIKKAIEYIKAIK